MDEVKARYGREYQNGLRQLESLKDERKMVARKLSQSALDVAYKGWKLNLRLVEKLDEVEQKIAYTQKKIALFKAKM